MSIFVCLASALAGLVAYSLTSWERCKRRELYRGCFVRGNERGKEREEKGLHDYGEEERGADRCTMLCEGCCKGHKGKRIHVSRKAINTTKDKAFSGRFTMFTVLRDGCDCAI